MNPPNTPSFGSLRSPIENAMWISYKKIRIATGETQTTKKGHLEELADASKDVPNHGSQISLDRGIRASSSKVQGASSCKTEVRSPIHDFKRMHLG
jgi:hypothetical protein